MARRRAALLVTLKGKINMARRHSALLVTLKGKIDVARRDATLLVTLWSKSSQRSSDVDECCGTAPWYQLMFVARPPKIVA